MSPPGESKSRSLTCQMFEHLVSESQGKPPLLFLRNCVHYGSFPWYAKKGPFLGLDLSLVRLPRHFLLRESRPW